MKILTTGRHDLEAYFNMSGIRTFKKLPHTPFIVFVTGEDLVQVNIVDNILALLEFPDDTQVMAQWAGKSRSDFFRFTVGQLRQFIKTHPRDDYQII